jgi:hypothetical protein
MLRQGLQQASTRLYEQFEDQPGAQRTSAFDLAAAFPLEGLGEKRRGAFGTR